MGLHLLKGGAVTIFIGIIDAARPALPRVYVQPRNLCNGVPSSSLALGSCSSWYNRKVHITVKAVNFYRENGIIMVSFPSHTLHQLQSLPMGIYGSFKSYCPMGLVLRPSDQLTSNPGKTLRNRTNNSLIKIARNITKSFEAPGLWPLNRQAFSLETFLPNFAKHIHS